MKKAESKNVIIELPKQSDERAEQEFGMCLKELYLTRIREKIQAGSDE